MFDEKTSRKIIGFVAAQPRSIDEIAKYIGKNWRTADRYITRIVDETGRLGIRTFRGGTRGALKVVYLAQHDRVPGTEAQDVLLARILAGREKEDFSPLDIYENVDPKRCRAFIESFTDDPRASGHDIISLLRGAQRQILSFSGNLSWVNHVQGSTRVIDVLAQRAEAGVAIKVVSRVDYATLANLRKIDEVNSRVGHDAIEVRHADQPLRGLIIDDRVIRFREALDPARYRPGELEQRTFIFYDISDPAWIRWASQVFWKLFQAGTSARRRLAAIASIKLMGKDSKGSA